MMAEIACSHENAELRYNITDCEITMHVNKSCKFSPHTFYTNVYIHVI